nr:MAG TPA: hypothetical protein [Caudoviricetes sp.]
MDISHCVQPPSSVGILLSAFPLYAKQMPGPEPFHAPAEHRIDRGTSRDCQNSSKLSEHQYPRGPRRSVFCFFVRAFIQAGQFVDGGDEFEELTGQQHLAGDLDRIFGVIVFAQLSAVKVGEYRCCHDHAAGIFVGIHLVLPLLTYLFLAGGCLEQGRIFFLGQGADLKRNRFAICAEKALGNDKLLFFRRNSGMQKCGKCAHKEYLLSVAQIDRVGKCFQTVYLGVAEIEVIVQHGFVVVQDGQRDLTGQHTAIIAHDLIAHAGRGVVVGDGDIKGFHYTSVDILQQHIGEQVAAVGTKVDIAGAGLRDTIGLFLHRAGADGLHVRGLNASHSLDVFHAADLCDAAITSDGDFAFGTVQGVLCKQIH